MLVEEHIEQRGVRNPDVLRAMRQVPRHEFVPEHLRDEAYDDRPLSIGYGATSFKLMFRPFQIPVTKIITKEAVGGIGIITKAEPFQVLLTTRDGFLEPI